MKDTKYTKPVHQQNVTKDIKMHKRKQKMKEKTKARHSDQLL
jgi:hypothetical protein